MEPEKLVIFLADFDHQTERIRKVYALLEENLYLLSGEQISRQVVESTGYWLHNLYCAFEDLFKIVASFWENNVAADGAWHRKLLDRMTVHIEGIRPALLSEESFCHLNEIRGFRHVFRHAYSHGLDDERVAFLLRRVLRQKNIVFDDIACFRKKISDV